MQEESDKECLLPGKMRKKRGETTTGKRSAIGDTIFAKGYLQ